MDILKIVLLFIFIVSTQAEVEQAFVIDDVKVSCISGSDCSDFEEQYNEMKGTHYTVESLRNKLRFYLLDKTVEKFEYKVLKRNAKNVLSIELSRKKITKSLEIVSNVNVEMTALKKQLPLKPGKVFGEGELQKTKKMIVDFFANRGFSELKIDVKKRIEGNELELVLNVFVGKLVQIKDVEIVYPKGSQKFFEVEKILQKFKKKTWNKYQFLYEVDQISQRLFRQGYFFAEAKSLPPVFSKDNKHVSLTVNVKPGARHNFNFIGNNLFTHQDLLQKLKDNIRNSFGEFSIDELAEVINKHYEESGIFNSKARITLRSGKDKFGRSYHNYFVNITEGKKISVTKLSFIGNRNFSLEKIKELYYEKASSLARRDYLDLKFSNEFSKLLKNEYLRKGYIFSVVEEPLYSFNKNSEVVIEYKIKERQQSLLSEIKLIGANDELKKKILPKLINKVGQPINVVELEKDLNTIIELARNNGYFYATITNVGNKNLVKYESNYSRAKIVVNINAGKKTIYDSSLITGHNKTKIHIIEREIDLVNGELLTPEKVALIRSKIYSLGLFSLVRVSPFVKSSKDQENYHVNLLVQLQEKDFGSAEIAPGYRSDIGYKFSTGVSYNNLWGKNHSLSGKLQANLRDNFNNLDERRRSEEKRVLEYSANVKYSWPFLFHKFLGTKINLDISSSFRRKRFFDFDANIFKVSPRLSKQFNQYFNASIKYQLETISQFDATDEIDNDSFRIGGITPAISLDFRDSRIAPTKGAFFSLSWEFANPMFGSMNEEDLEVNFSKLVSRNNFYLPLSRDVVLATSVSFGYEKNYANEFRTDDNGNAVTKGFIPSVKVFRLDGVDSVRGFRNNEINILKNGKDIGNVVIRDKAFFTNIKIEPRYYVSDALVVGAFLDAGRVFINSYAPVDLRTSAGATLKLLTPVGSLNLDYGIKLKREKLTTGAKESFGRFHLSIGFF